MLLLCNLEYDEKEGRYFCKNEGCAFKTPPLPPGKRFPGGRRCDGNLQRNKPTIIQKAWNYIEARKKWKAAGSPERTDEEAQQLLTICKACDYLIAGSCSLCGCPIDRKKWWGDKLKWATEHCPDKRW